MKSTIILLTISFITLMLGCKNSHTEDGSSSTLDGTQQVDKKIDLPNLAKVNDIAVMKSKISNTVSQINEAKKELTSTKHSMTINGKADTPIQVWYQNEIPIKIKCGVANEAGNFTDSFEYYLRAGKLWYVDAIYAHYIYTNGTLTHWLDENWQPNTNIPTRDIKTKEESHKATVNQIVTILSKGK